MVFLCSSSARPVLILWSFSAFLTQEICTLAWLGSGDVLTGLSNGGLGDLTR